jgi:hypothetical protein
MLIIQRLPVLAPMLEGKNISLREYDVDVCIKVELAISFWRNALL